MTEPTIEPVEAPAPETVTAPTGLTIGDNAHAIAQLATEISKDHRGLTTSDAIRCVQIALENNIAKRALLIQEAQLDAMNFGPADTIEEPITQDEIDRVVRALAEPEEN